jgi:amino acid adenylation domain-containing protein/non-ribosomal peptide synthase protein (TIGR01720 family)
VDADIVKLLQRRAVVHPDRVALRYLGDGATETEALTYGELDRRVRVLAGVLQDRAAHGDRAMLLYPSGVDYVVAFLACLYTGVVAVPVYPPESALPEHMQRLRAILHDAAPRLLLTAGKLAAAIERISDSASGMALPSVLETDALDGPTGADERLFDLSPEDLAFLQYTSGSTGTPKGVRVTHGNLMANQVAIAGAFGMGSADTVVSWLPLYHDMGLIGGLLQPLFSGISVVLMSPRAFLERPARWLEAIGRYGGTVSGAPDFAYRLCIDRVPESALRSFDLRTWRLAFSGSEPIRAATLRDFAARFGAAGFDPRALYPCYGLAEATLFVTGGRSGRGFDAARVDPEGLAAHLARPLPAGTEVVDCGFPREDHEVRIVGTGRHADPDYAPTSGTVRSDAAAARGPDAVGEIWFSGPSVANGYWNNPGATAQAFVHDAGKVWLRTGDLGFLHGGSLFVTGRLKDMIIVRGQNFYPQDIEATLEANLDLLRKGRVAAFAVECEEGEAIGIAAEIGKGAQKLVPLDGLAREISRLVTRWHHQKPAVVMLLHPGAMPRTTSGKIQRSACRRLYSDGGEAVAAVFDGSADGTSADGGAARAAAGDKPEVRPPADGVEAVLREIWCEVLNVPAIADGDDFFALGGDSLAVARAGMRIQEALGGSVEPRVFFESSTFPAFADAVRHMLAVSDGAGQARDAGPIVQAPSLAAQASPAQARMWFLWRMEPQSSFYTVAASVAIEGRLEPAEVQAAFDMLAGRHAAMRTTFREHGDGRLFQQVGTAALVPVRVDDLRDLPEVRRDEVLAAIRRSEATAAFDLEQGPLWRVRLVRLAETAQVLVVAAHHIVTDAHSMNILADEFARLLAAARGGAGSALAQPAIQYGDFAAWHSRLLEGETGERQLAYWRERLSGEPAALDMPTERPRPARQSHRGAVLRFRFGSELADAVRNYAGRSRATVFAVLLAAFKAWLYRYTGQSDLWVGVPFANRRRETEAVVGLFVNTVVLRSRIDGRQGFEALLSQVRETILQAQANADLPFDRVVQTLQPDRSVAYNPLFQVMFNHVRRRLGGLAALPDLRAVAALEDGGVAKFDLGLNIAEDDDGALSGEFVYATDLFDAATVERFRNHYLRLLGGLCQTPAEPLNRLSLLDGAQATQLMEWSGAATREPAVREPWTAVHERIWRIAPRHADDTALIFDTGQWRYAELLDRAGAIAEALRDAGAGPECVVGIAMDRSPQAVASVLGVLTAGAAYLPLDPDYPADRLEYMMRDAGVAHVLVRGAEGHDAVAAPAGRLTRIDVDALPLPTGGRPSRHYPAVAPGSLAYVLYTSGTTGHPKGVGNTHGALASRLAWMQSEYRLSPQDTLLQKTPASFDVAVWEMLWPLSHGARVVIAPPGDHRDPLRLARLIQRHAVTAVHFVPSMWQLFAAQDEAAACRTLRLLFSGGEALPASLQSEILARFPGVRLDNRYGPTEALINASCWTCREENRPRVPIGRPLADTSLHVLDDDMMPVPVGVPGDLYIGGAALARGYVGSAGLTAGRFLPDPYSLACGARLYRSGDRARWRSDGVLEYLGRDDDQVKIRGFRVELQEIEARLRELPGVRAAATTTHPGADGGPSLAAYLVLSQASPPLSELKQRAAAQLPDFMMPASWTVMDALPSMHNGKLDRSRLPAPAVARGGYVSPGSEDERRIAGIWQQVLQVDQPGMRDNFFALGGHSLLATRIVSRVRKLYCCELPLRTLFEHSDLDAFCAAVLEYVREHGTAATPEPRVVDRTRPLALSYSQERMWFLWRMEPDGVAYNVGGAATLHGTLDAAALTAAVRAMTRRHEALRTTFPEVDGVPVQRIAAEAEVPLDWVDFSALPAEQRHASLAALRERQAHQPFDLRNGPTLRIVVARMAPDEHVLLLTAHHILAEGWGMDVYAAELGHLYEAHVQSRDADLPALRIQYADFAAWQRQWLASGQAARQLAYWRDALRGGQAVLDLPADYARPPVQSLAGDTLAFTLDPQSTALARAHASRDGSTLFATAAAALFALLHRYTGQRDLSIGFPIANRTRPEFEGLVGAFLNTLVLRCQVDPAMAARELLRKVREASLDAQSNQDVPFHMIVDAVRPDRSAAYTPLFQVMCVVQDWGFQRRRAVGGLAVEYQDNDSRNAKFDLILNIVDDGRDLRCAVTYATALFKRETAERIGRHWRNCLRAMLLEPERPIGGLDFLDARERQPATSPPAPLAAWQPGDAVHETISAHARTRPRHPALVHQGRAWDYAWLVAQADILARRLRAQGIAEGRYAAIAMERSPRLIVAMLAVLKSGGAFVPLDPRQPPDRMAILLQDLSPGVLLTDPALAARLPRSGVATWGLDDEGDGVDVEVEAEAASDTVSGPASNRASADQDAGAGPVHPQSIAYCIYTSGSTGKPKGVAVAHGPLAMHCRAVADLYEMRADDRELQFAAVGFDIAHERWMVPLMCGATIVLDDATQWPPEQLAREIARQEISVLFLPPAYMNQVLAAGVRLPLRRCIVGGEAWLSRHAARALEMLGEGCLIHAYGPTETVIAPLAIPVSAAMLGQAPYTPIGRPVGPRTAYVLDADMNPVPPGIVGELYVGGAGLAREYQGRPALTAAAFVPDPYTAQSAGGRLYRTGDFVRCRADGVHEYVGRADDQVKIRGLRVEPGEIEACLNAQAEVGACTVVARDSGRGMRLVAYVVPAPSAQDATDLASRLDAHARRSLPEYMVPGRIVLLPRLPMTANGKVDRRALPEPDWTTPDGGMAQPEGELERQLAAIWRDVLGNERIGATDNFFESGGDSILSLQVVSRAQLAGIAIGPRDLFQAQTVRALAALVRDRQPPPAAYVRPAGDVPLTPVQCWFFERDMPRPHHWNQALLLEPAHPLDAAVLEQALGQVAAHHDAFRLRFARGDAGQWRQYLDAGDGSVELRRCHAANEAALARIGEEAQRDLDLAAGPLWRAVLIDRWDGRNCLLMVIHHLIVDGVSWRILLQDLQAVYRGMASGDEARLPPATASFQAWSEALLHHARAGDDIGSTASRAYWREHAPTPETAVLPADEPAGSNAAAHRRSVELRLDAALTDAILDAAPRAYRARPTDLLLAALARALCRWSGRNRVCIDLEGHGRGPHGGLPDVSRTIGWFTAIYPVTLRAGDENDDPGALLRGVKEQLRAVPDGGLGYGVLRYLGADRAAPAAAPDAAFNYLGKFDHTLGDDPLFSLSPDNLGAVHDGESELAHRLSVNARVQDGRLVVSWHYSSQRYRDGTVEALAADFRATLSSLVDHCLGIAEPICTPSDFPLAALTQARLDALPAAPGGLEDVYPLSAMQEGLLFHTLYSTASRLYVNQLCARVDDLDPARLRRAWQATTDAHPVLRTAFATPEDGGEPLQMVMRRVVVPVEIHDWRDREAGDADLQALALTERARGFDLAVAPCQRLVLVRLQARRWQLVWSYHHLLLDGWSAARMLSEVLSRYRAEDPARGWPVPVGKYADYIAWLRRQDGEAAQAFWRSQVAPLSQPTLLADTLPPGQETGHGVTDCMLDAAATDRLATYAQRERVTLNTLLQAAWLLVLRRYTGRDVVAFGATVADRPASLPFVENTLGLYINTLPVVQVLRPDAHVGQWLRALQDHNARLREYGHTPLKDIQRWAGGSTQALFDSLLVFENYPVDEVLHREHSSDGLAFSEVRVVESTNYPLTLTVKPGNTLAIRFGYARDRLAASSVSRLCEHLRRALECLCEDADAPIGALDILPQAQTARLLRDGEGAARAYPRQCIHVQFEAQARRAPGAIAVTDCDRQLTYGELNACANRLARRLRAAGAGPDAHIALLLDRSLEMVIAILAVLKAGAAYVPLDAEYPESRLAYMLGDAGARILLTQRRFEPRWAGPEVAVWHLDDVAAEATGTAPEGESAAAGLGCDASPGNLAYCIYTSGSTGQPKGAANTHEALANRLYWMQAAYALTPDDAVLQKTPFSFDVSVWEFLWPLLNGARLVMAPPGAHKDADALRDLIDRHAVTVVHFVPSMLCAFAEALTAGACPTLRQVICSGEALPVAVRDLFAGRHGARLHNLYGPTEAAIDVSFWECRDDPGAHSVPIGHPIFNTRLHLLDDAMNLAPPGTAGELYLGGIGLARGYHGRPALTAERFVPDPFSATGGERLYRSGDVARRRPDGALDYLGRIDHQVKIRGQRIELGEIEASLNAQREVRASAVVARDDGAGPRLIGYAVLAEGVSDGAAMLSAIAGRLAQTLPGHMVPTRLVVLQELPRLPNGKLDRKSLPDPGTTPSTPHAAPEGEAEILLASIWQRLLGVPRVGVLDNFFELGGDSILSLRAVSQARQGGLALTPRDLFEHPTVRALASVARPARSPEPANDAPVGGPAPLTPVQRWFFEQELAVPSHWNQAVLLRPLAEMDAELLTRALRRVADWHDVLRLRYRVDADGQWRQDYRPPEAGDAPMGHDLLRRARVRDAAELEELCRDVQGSLDLRTGPLLRAALIRMEDGSQRLLVAVHHLIIDGVSWRILLEDLGSAYRQLLQGAPVRLPAKTGSYAEWGRALSRLAESPDLLAELPFWRDQLRPEDLPELPVDKPDGAGVYAAHGMASVELDATQTRRLLRDVLPAARCSLEEALIAIVGRVLCRWTGAQVQRIDIESHGRDGIADGPDVTRTVGWFTAMYPLRLALSAGSDIAVHLGEAKARMRQVPRRGMGYGVLRYLGRMPLRDGAVPTRPGVLFNYMGRLDGDEDDGLWRFAQESVGPTQHESNRASHCLMVDAAVREGRLRMTWHYRRDVLEPATVARLVDGCRDDLAALAARDAAEVSPGLAPEDFPLASLTAEQLGDLSLDAARTADIYPLAPMQQGMLFHSLYDPEAGQYLNQLSVEVRGLDTERFVAAWAWATRRHAILRTAFIWKATMARPLQWVARDLPPPVSIVDLAYADSEVEAAVRRLEDAEREQAFDLASPPLHRIVLARIGEGRHRLVWTSHHALMDGWSASRLMAEVLRHYRDVPVDTPPGVYRDYIAWLACQDAEGAQAYWKRQLSRLAQPCLLGAALVPSDPGEGYALEVTSLDAADTARIKQFGQRERVTLNTVVQGAWLLLLQRYTGQRTVAFGATVSGRPASLPGAGDTLGLFINTLPVIQAPRPDEAVGPWLRALQAHNAELREYEHTPLYEIQRWAGQGGQALFDTILVFENYPVDQVLRQAGGGALVFDDARRVERTHYPLAMAVQVDDVMRIEYEFQRDRFDAEQVRAVCKQFKTLLLALAADGDALLGDIELLAADERRLLLEVWNQRADEYHAPALVHELFQARARRDGDATAIVFQDATLSYRLLNSRANRLARRLRGLDVGPDVVVGVCMERCVDLVVTLMAIMKAGGAYLPLDPDYPAERLAFMLEDSGAPLVITRQAMLSSLPGCVSGGGVRLLCVDDGGSDDGPDTDLPTISHPQDLAYCIYTSGSTGVPKAVENTQHGLVHRMEWMRRHYGFEVDDIVLHKAPFSFDVSVWELFLPLVTGATLVVAAPGEHRDPARICALLKRHRITTVHFVPAMLKEFLSHPEAAHCVEVKQLFSGGDALTPALQDMALRSLPDVKLHNRYGPTEALIFVSHWTCMPGPCTSIPIGRPVRDTEIHILDKDLRLVPPGAVGEIHIGGAGLARGYRRRAGATADRFVPNPHGWRPGERLYRTGDLGRWRADGAVEYLGRIDHQVKIRGLRVEPGEIQARLLASGLVRDALVTARDFFDGKRLVAYMIAPAGGQPAGDVCERARSYLAAALPEHMVPAYLIEVDGFPLMPNGKVDLHALPAPAPRARTYTEPGDALERAVADLWQDVLGVERVGTSDDFFELGGHSLHVAQLASRIQRDFRMALPLKEVFAHPTVAELAALIRRERDAQGEVDEMRTRIAGMLSGLED